jgi:rod shape-determining protein MreC
MNWYKEHWRLTAVSAVLIFLLIVTLVSYAGQGSNSWLGKRIESVTAYIQEPVTNGGNAVTTTIRGLFQFRGIMAENEKLKEENTKLQKELIDAALSNQELKELKQLSSSLNYISPSKKYKHVTASVIGTDSAQLYNIFTINEGTNQGIVKDSVVINADGLVGRIYEAGPNWSKVMAVIDENNNVSFQIFRNLGLLGILSGDGTGGLSGYMLDAKASVIKGDTLITSGMELYPQGIPIGTITAVHTDKDALLQRITVKPAVNFDDIQKVTVIITAQ